MKRFVFAVCSMVLFVSLQSVAYGHSMLFPMYHESFTYNGNVLTGKGIKVGIIDTGIDYNHPDLQKNYRGGYDFIDQDHDPMEGSTSDGSSTHGTHVAGIIAGDGVKKGVAPNAELYVYRALSSAGEGGTDTVVQAIEKAIEDKVDVLNLSLGNNLNIPDYPTTAALNKAVEQGMVVVVANGNSGPNFWTVGSPAVSEKAISVGAMSDAEQELSIQIGKSRVTLTPFSNAPMFQPTETLEVVDGGIGDWEQLKHAKNKVVLIERGRYTFDEKVRRAKKTGAVGVIMMNHKDGPFYGGVEQKVDIPVMSVTKGDGEQLKQAIAEKAKTVQIERKQLGMQLASFSSKGPVVGTWTIKPDIVAPGVHVFSTVPTGYELMNGTSMAAPYITGACALLKEAHPDWTNEEIKAALMNTGTILQASNGERYHALEQGAGRVRLQKAIDAKTIVTPGSFSFGQLENEDVSTQTVALTIKNKENKEKIYTFSAEKQHGITFQFPEYIKLAANEEKTVKVDVIIDPKAANTVLRDAFFYIKSKHETMHVPFLYASKHIQYPSVMAFHFHYNQEEKNYAYEVYVPNGAKKLTIDLYDMDTFLFVRSLDERVDMETGVHKAVVTEEQVRGLKGGYFALLTIHTGQTIETVQTYILFE